MAESKKVSVVGCNGFIGSHISLCLLEKGHDVRGSVRCAADDAKVSWLNNLKGKGSFTVVGDVNPSDESSLDKLIAGTEWCVIAAGINDPAYPEWPEEMVKLTTCVMNSCSKNGIKAVVLLTSTGTTNPPSGEPEFKREDEHFSDPELQRTQKKFASCAKTLAEKTAFKMGEESGIRVSAICPSAVLGPRLCGTAPSDFIVKLCTGEKKWEKCPNGSMSFVDVRDLAALHVAALENENAQGRFFGVCRNSSHFQDVAQMIADNRSSVTVPPLEGERKRVTHFDFTKQDFGR
jgi:nucleoside-diphosphate-sugar epimerase